MRDEELVWNALQRWPAYLEAFDRILAESAQWERATKQASASYQEQKARAERAEAALREIADLAESWVVVDNVRGTHLVKLARNYFTQQEACPTCGDTWKFEWHGEAFKLACEDTWHFTQQEADHTPPRPDQADRCAICGEPDLHPLADEEWHATNQGQRDRARED